MRVQNGDRSIFVTSPTERRYDTPLAQLLKRSLAALSDSVELARLGSGRGTGDTLAGRRAVALRLLQHAKLREVRAVRDIPIHSIRGALRYRHAREVARFIELYRDAVEDQTARQVHEVLTRQLLIPEKVDRLFELYAGFRIIESLRGLGYEQVHARVVPSRNLPFARLVNAAGDRITVWYQRGLTTILAPPGVSGEYAKALQDASLSPSSLRPDFMIVREPDGPVLLVEAKFTSREDESPDRVGLRDALMYLHDGKSFLSSHVKPRALVIAWNSRAIPNVDADIMLCSQTGITKAITEVVGAWNGAS